jgi:hypothetical protein
MAPPWKERLNDRRSPDGSSFRGEARASITHFSQDAPGRPQRIFRIILILHVCSALDALRHAWPVVPVGDVLGGVRHLRPPANCRVRSYNVRSVNVNPYVHAMNP